MDGWENDRGERLCPGCSFCVSREGEGGMERRRRRRMGRVLSLSFTRLSPDLSMLRLNTGICRMPGMSRKRGGKNETRLKRTKKKKTEDRSHQTP